MRRGSGTYLVLCDVVPREFALEKVLALREGGDQDGGGEQRHTM